MRPTLKSFRYRLPVLALLVCYAMLAVVTAVYYRNFRRDFPTAKGDQVYSYELLRQREHSGILRTSIAGAASSASPLMLALNFPAITIEAALEVMMKTWPDPWDPPTFRFFMGSTAIWRGLAFPVYCLPFWWFAGLGMDAVLGRSKLHWSVLLLGTLLMAFCLLIVAGLTSVHCDAISAYIGLALWSALLTTFPAAWWRMYRQARKNRLITSMQ